MKLSKQCQRVLSLLLAILFLATSMPSSVYASEISVSQEAAYTETVDEADTQEAEGAEEQPDAQIQEEQPEVKEEEKKEKTEQPAVASDVVEKQGEVKSENIPAVESEDSTDNVNTADDDTTGETDYLPVITSQPQSVSKKMAGKTSLTVAATAPGDGELSYQWYQVEDDDTETAVASATASKYRAPINEVGIFRYYCKVTNTVNGKSYSVNTEIATVTVYDEYLTFLEITKDDNRVFYQYGAWPGKTFDEGIELDAASAYKLTMGVQSLSMISTYSMTVSYNGEEGEVEAFPSNREVILDTSKFTAGEEGYFTIQVGNYDTAKKAYISSEVYRFNVTMANSAMVTDMKLIAGKYSTDDPSQYVDILDGKFKAGTMEYDNITLTGACTGVYMKLSDEIKKSGTIYYEATYNDTKEQSGELSKDAIAGDAVAFKLKSLYYGKGETVKVQIKVGTKQDGEWDALETYTFNISKMLYVDGVTVQTGGMTVGITPEKTSGMASLESTFRGYIARNTTSVDLNVSMGGTTAVYIDGVETKTATLDVKKYTTEDGSKAVIPFAIKWEDAEGTERTRDYTVELIFGDLPVITAQPEDVLCKTGTATTLTVATSVKGDGQLSYQWYEVSTSGAGTAIDDATEATYTPATAEEGNRKYYCVITNTADGQTYTQKSNTATVSVVDVDIPQITEQPSDITCAKDAAVALYVTVSKPESGSLGYYWHEVGDTSTYMSGRYFYIPDTSEAGTKEYVCQIRWYYNGNTYYIESGSAKVTVDENYTGTSYVPVITKQPVSVSCNKDDKIVLSVEAEGTAGGELSYQWFNGGSDGNAIEGATSATYEPATNIGNGGGWYFCAVTNTVDGKKYIAKSDTAGVRVKLTYITPPKFTRDIGSYYKDTYEGEIKEYQTEYKAGEAPKPFCVQYEWYDLSVQTKLEVYHNTTDSFEGAELVTDTRTMWGRRSALSGDTAIQLNQTYDEGTHYFFLKLTVSANNNDTVEPVSVISGPVALTFAHVEYEFDGTGTATNPYKINNVDDLLMLQKLVNEGTSFLGAYFQFTDDITLPDGWKPMGCTVDGTSNVKDPSNLHAFSGIIDGNGKTVTVPAGGLPLLGYVYNATVKNLNIYGTQIEGSGLVNNYTGVGLSGNAIVIDNVRLKNGTKTLDSGLVASTGGNGYACASAGFVVTIRNSVIEDGVIVGYTGNKTQIGSFAGRCNIKVENCTSSATVKGKDYVGGIIGGRDNAMSTCVVKNSKFHGTVEASGSYAGGIVGGGYDNQTAPNGACPTIMNCTVDGTVKGDERVGGIFGGDGYVAQTWSNVVGAISANTFTGKVSGNKYVGGIIGYRNSLNRYDNAHVR